MLLARQSRVSPERYTYVLFARLPDLFMESMCYQVVWILVTMNEFMQTAKTAFNAILVMFVHGVKINSILICCSITVHELASGQLKSRFPY